MPTNVEIKARVRDVRDVRRRARAVAAGDPERLRQEDTYFRVPRGRLKLRVFEGGRGELIYYEREDALDPTPSDYLVTPVTDTAALKTLLLRALGVVGVVRKLREVYMVGRTRVHVDEVEALGGFMELEVVLGPGDPEAGGRAEAERLMRELAVEPADLVSGSYIDLLMASKT